MLIRILQQELLYPLPLFQRICHSLLSTHGSFKLSFLQRYCWMFIIKSKTNTYNYTLTSSVTSSTDDTSVRGCSTGSSWRLSPIQLTLDREFIDGHYADNHFLFNYILRIFFELKFLFFEIIFLQLFNMIV